LERLQDKCAKENKFVEAELCKQRIEYFKNLEKEKLLENLKERHRKAVRFFFYKIDQLDIEKKEELDKFNEKQDEEYFKLRDKFEAMETSIREKQLKEYDAKKLEIENEISNSVAKPSCEAIQLNAILENLIKMKEFTQAHDVQIQLTNVVKNDHEKLKLENEKRIPMELEKISNKHEIELNAFKLKMKSSFDEYKKNRALSYEK
jgi:hypothetical protein